MFKMRQEQENALGQAKESEFLRRLAGFLREEFPDAHEMSDADLEMGVKQQTTRARSYGLENEDEIATYTVTAWQLGENFDTEFPAAQYILKSPDYTPAEKSDWLEAWTVKMFEELEED